MNLIARKRDSDSRSAVPLRMQRLFGNLLDLGGGLSPLGDHWTPAMDVVDTAEAIEVAVDLPGVDPSAVDVTIREDRLELTGSREPRSTDEDARWYRFERAAGTFHRALRLPVPIDVDAATARAKNGVLHIVLPKTADVKPKRIEIKGS